MLGQVCNEYLDRYHDNLAGAAERGEPGVAVSRRHARILDGLLQALYCASNAVASAVTARPGGRVALVGVGGYGRGLVGLHSDIDVLFLCEDPSDRHVAALAEGLLYPLWDLGFDIGHAVRGVDETLALARQDIRTATTLLDLRWIGGDRRLVEDLVAGGRRHVFDPALEAFLAMLSEDTEARHERFGGSLYLLEPDVKLGRGGLRDLDVAQWAANARWGARTTEEYVRCGVLLAREVDELERAREMLWRVRNLLHLRAGRQQDRLTFADQEEIAQRLGFVDGVTLAVEQFMQAYYRHARVVAHTAERMIARAGREPRPTRAEVRPLEDGLLLFDGRVTLEDSDRLGADPTLSLRFYEAVVRLDKPPYPFARDAIARVTADASFGEALRDSEDAAPAFLRLLTHAGAAPLRRRSILAELHEVGLLAAMIPEMGPLTGRVQHDVYNVYTVDVHSIAAVDRLRGLARGDMAGALPMASRLAAEAPRPVPLFLAVLLHEIGKVHGRDWSRRGAELARPIAARLGLDGPDADHVAWLVEEALSLYHWATRRDTSDPDTIVEIARRVGTVDRLRDLFLLTVVDLSTTNPTAMTAWKARVLEELYIAVVDALEGAAPSSGQGRAGQIRRDAAIGFVGDLDEAALHAFVRDMPERYLLSNPVDVIRAHARAARDRGDALVSVRLGPGPSEDVVELVFITDDRPGLLADATAVLAAHRLGVISAQIYTRDREGRGPEAFDVFHVRRLGRGVGGEVPGSLVERVERDFERLVTGEITADELLARASATPAWARVRAPEVPTQVTVDNDASPRFTVVDVHTRDRTGLLHVMARTMHAQGLSIALSKVSTEGVKVADVFYVTDADGDKVRDPERLRALARTLQSTLEAFHAEAAE